MSERVKMSFLSGKNLLTRSTKRLIIIFNSNFIFDFYAVSLFAQDQNMNGF